MQNKTLLVFVFVSGKRQQDSTIDVMQLSFTESLCL